MQIILIFEKFKKMKITKIGDSTNPTDFSNPEEIHLVWIGTYLTENSLMMIESIEQCKNLNVKVNLWIDTDFYPEMKAQPVYPWLYIRDIKSLNYFYLVREHIYPLFMKEKVYNYLKEIFSLMVLTEHGGYYFDTTTILTVESDTIVSLPSHNKFVAPYYKKCTCCDDNIGFDVYFYYSPKNYSLTKEMLFFMVNMFHLKFFYRRDSESELHKISFEKFIDTYPELFNCKIRDDLSILGVIKRKIKAFLRETVLLSHLYMYHSYIDVSNDRLDILNAREVSETHKYNISDTIEASKFFGRTEWESNPSWIILFDRN